MIWSEWDTWIVIVGALCAAACALPGCFLLLRGMSMMGDAISHAVLPGIAIAFLVTESRASLPMFLGAAIVGVLTAVFTQWVSRFGNVDRGAAMGIVFTTLFAAGLLILRQAADSVDLDAGCVLYGSIESTPMVRVFGGVPRAAVVVGVSFIVNLLFTCIFYKELRLSSFDPELANTLGFSSGLMHYLLMTIVAVTTVAAFEVVGSIIVIAMLIVPPATAFLLTRRLSLLLVLSVLLGGVSALLGHLGSSFVPSLFGFEQTTTSGMMAAAAGCLFILVWAFNPQGGLIIRFFRNFQKKKT